jgi:TolB-like protein/DNA-binding winged helix-turn-helix (wHTH) protein/Flp pilus assembly protein TadD
VAVKVFEFADFKLDCDRFELYRAGRTLKLERKPMELLVLLAAKNGNLVTRTEIAEHLWDSEVFVDTEHGINTAVRKIREVLQDDPGQSRFVQTVTGKGYRFVAPIVEVSTPSLDQQPRLPQPESTTREIADTLPSLVPPAAPPIQSPPPGNSHRRLWLTTLATLAAIALLIFAIRGTQAFRARSKTPAITSLAVLPLDNLTGDPSQDYFADGMTDELTTMLAKNSTLRVISRTSVMQYRGAHRPLREIAQALGVDGILEGSVSRSGDKMHMTIQLIQASNDAHVWAESYDRDPNDIASLPRQATQTIAIALHSAVPKPSPADFVRPEAQDAYLRGRYLQLMGRNIEAARFFRKAIELQPDYAQGWAGLSLTYGDRSFGEPDPRNSLAQQEANATQAVKLNDSLPEAHLALGGALALNQWNWTRAEQEFDRAIELDPALAEAYNLHAKIRAQLNRHDEAIEWEKKAQQLDPLRRRWAMIIVYTMARQYDAAVNDALQKLEANPQDRYILWPLFDAYRSQGKTKEAAETLEKIYLSRGDPPSLASAATIRNAFKEGGYPAVVQWQLAQLKERAATHDVSPVEFALLNAQLGRREETIALLEEGYRKHASLLLFIQTEPAYDFLHSDPRYRAIVKGIGLPPAY